MSLRCLLRLAELDFSSVPLEMFGTGELKVLVAVFGALFAAGLLVDAVLLFGLIDRWRAWPRHVRRLVERPWDWLEAVQVITGVVALFGLAMLSHWVATRVLGISFDGQPSLAILLQSALIHWPAFGLLVYLLARWRVGWTRAFGIRGRQLLRDAGLGVLLYLAMLPLVGLTSVIYTLVLHLLDYPMVPQDVALAITADAPLAIRVYLLLLAALVAPLFEELMFRGIGLPVVARRWGAGPAIVLVSLCFAAVHFHVPSFMAMFVLAVCFSLAYIYTGSIVVPTVMHGLFNAVNLSLMLYLRSSAP